MFAGCSETTKGAAMIATPRRRVMGDGKLMVIDRNLEQVRHQSSNNDRYFRTSPYLYQIRLITVSLCNSELASGASCVRHSSVTLSAAKGLSRWVQRCFAALSMTM